MEGVAMKERKTFALLFLLGFVLGIVLMTVDVRAQQPASDSGTTPYNVVSSFEIGVRGVSVDGNADKFRSDLNYQPGIRLFDSSFLMKSNGGDGLKLFDSLLVNSSGWGADPSGYLRVNVDKSTYYKFDATVRRFDYFNSLRNLALNQHIADTRHTMGDFDLTLLPSNDRLKFTVGYSMDRTSGSSLTTYDYARDEFPILAPERSETNEYRVGVDARLGPLDLSFQQGLRYFKDDTTYTINAKQLGNNITNTSVLDSLHRDLPTRGRIPFTRFSLHSLIAKRLDVTGRFIYQSATTRFSLFETITGKDASNNNITLDSLNISGDTKRPNAIGDLGITLFATDRLRISDTVRVNAFHITGGDELNEALFRTRTTPTGDSILPPVLTNTLAFRTTSYRRASNTIEVDYDFHARFSGHVGHRYTDRHAELSHLDLNLAQAPPTPAEPEEFNNRTNAYFFGFKARPFKIWTNYFDFERGQTDNVFTRIDNYDFTNVRIRSILKPTSNLAINMSLVTKDNNNPSLTDAITRLNFGADIKTRIYSTSVSWFPNGKFSLDSGYTYSHATSDAVIVFFANSIRTTGLSRFFVRDDFVFLNTSVQLHPRASLFTGYRIHRDRGQGDRVSAPDVLIGSYPYQFQTPEFRLAVRLHNRLDWNVGYQYYDFKEKFVNNQFYQAHLPYTSLRIYFGRGND
jgi:hypothetical protein